MSNRAHQAQRSSRNDPAHLPKPGVSSQVRQAPNPSGVNSGVTRRPSRVASRLVTLQDPRDDRSSRELLCRGKAAPSGGKLRARNTAAAPKSAGLRSPKPSNAEVQAPNSVMAVQRSAALRSLRSSNIEVRGPKSVAVAQRNAALRSLRPSNVEVRAPKSVVVAQRSAALRSRKLNNEAAMRGAEDLVWRRSRVALLRELVNREAAENHRAAQPNGSNK